MNGYNPMIDYQRNQLLAQQAMNPTGGMSADELRHASTLIKKANSRLPGGEEKLRLKSYEKEIQEITAQM